MPVVFHPQDPFSFSVPPPMRFEHCVVVWSLASLLRDLRPTPASLASHEASQLSQELQLTRESLEEVRSLQDHCSWRVWALGWSLKGLVVVDLLLVSFLILSYWKRGSFRASSEAVTSLAIQGDTGGSSESEDLSPVQPKLHQGAPNSGGSSPKSKGRPTRPSDLRQRQWTWRGH